MTVPATDCTIPEELKRGDRTGVVNRDAVVSPQRFATVTGLPTCNNTSLILWVHQQLTTEQRVGKVVPADHLKRTDHGELAPLPSVDSPGQYIAAVVVVRSLEMIHDS